MLVRCVTAEDIRLSELEICVREDTCQSKRGQADTDPKAYLSGSTRKQPNDSNVPPQELEFDTLEAEVLYRIHELRETWDQGQKI